MEVKTANPVQFDDAVVNLMEFPQPRDAVQQVVDAPPDEVESHEDDEHLDPQRPSRSNTRRIVFIVSRCSRSSRVIVVVHDEE